MELPLDELRPLVCAVSCPDGDGVTFRLDGREVRLAGDRRFIDDVLALCDGRLSVAEIEERVPGDAEGGARDLIAALHGEGVVLDCTQAWRHFDWQSSVHAPLYRPVTPELLHELEGTASRPLAEPLRSVALAPGDTRTGELAAARRSANPGDGPHPVGFGELSTVLSLMYGRPAHAHRPVPSGGGLYPLLLHVLLRSPLAPLEPGVWWYDPGAAALELLAGPPSAAEEIFLPENTCEQLLGRGQPIVFLSADVARPSRKYSNRAYRFALIEVGAAMQNAYLAGAEMGLPIRAAAGFDERRAEERLRLGDGCVTLLSLLLGA